MKFSRLLCLALISGSVLSAAVCAQDNATASSCPGQPKIPTIFKADCSNVNEPDVKALCGSFIENQACKASPAYRKITGIHLEDLCPVMQYKIYEKENWPIPNRGEGGLAGKCEVMLMTGPSLKIRSKIGPYDLHELLHEYQRAILPFLNEHPMFGPTLAEGAKEIGDTDGAEVFREHMKLEVERLKNQLTELAAPSDKPCGLAQVYIEESLYLEDARNVYAFYRKLGPVPTNKTRQELAARENRMLFTVSSGKARPYLVSHGCWAF